MADPSHPFRLLLTLALVALPPLAAAAAAAAEKNATVRELWHRFDASNATDLVRAFLVPAVAQDSSSTATPGRRLPDALAELSIPIGYPKFTAAALHRMGGSNGTVEWAQVYEPGGPLRDPVVSPDGQTMFLAEEHITAVDATSGAVRWIWHATDRCPAWGMALSRDGSVLLVDVVSSGSLNWRMALNATTGAVLWNVEKSATSRGLGPAEADTAVVFAVKDIYTGAVSVWALDVATGKTVWEHPVPDLANHGATPDGSVYAYVSTPPSGAFPMVARNGSALGTELWSLNLVTHSVTSITGLMWSPDSRWLYVTEALGFVVRIEAKTGRIDYNSRALTWASIGKLDPTGAVIGMVDPLGSKYLLRNASTGAILLHGHNEYVNQAPDSRDLALSAPDAHGVMHMLLSWSGFHVNRSAPGGGNSYIMSSYLEITLP